MNLPPFPTLRRIFERLFTGSLVRRMVKNSGYLFSATGISAFIALLQSILVARLLGVAGSGTLGVIIMFTSVVNRLVSFRMGELVIKYVGQFSERGDKPRAAAVFKGAALAELAASLVAFGLIWVLSPLAAEYFVKDPAAASWFKVYGLIVLANLIAESSTGLLQIFDRFRRMAALTVLQSLLTLGIIALVYVSSGDLLGVLLAYLSGKTLGALTLSAAALQEARKRWGPGWWRAPLGSLRPQRRELTRFAVSTNLSASLSLVNKDSELLWVSFFTNNVQAGFYRTALALVNPVQLPVSPLPQATYPELARQAARGNWGEVRQLLRQGSILAGSYTLAASVALLVVGYPLIRYGYGPEFLPAYPGLAILLAGFLVANTFYWQRAALLAIGLPEFPTKINLALAAVKIAGTLLLVPRYGYLASAVLLSGAYILGVSVSVLRFRSELARREQQSGVQGSAQVKAGEPEIADIAEIRKV
jgi:O-antigen/teichoic acid export membrane protein